MKILKLYKLFNLIHAYIDLLLARSKPQAFPVELSVGTTSHCNLRCIQCPREGHDGNLLPYNEKLELDYYQSLEPLLKRARDVSLYGLGEPMIDPHYIDKVNYVTSFGADVSLSTNGTLMDEKRCRELIESGVKSIGISLDAARPETFNVVRPPGGLPEIIENIKCLTRLKKEMDSTLPMLRLSYGIMPYNLKELPEFPDIAHETGCEEIIVHPVIFMSARKHNELWVDKEEMKKPVELARQRAEQYGIPFYFWDLDTQSFLKAVQYVNEQRGLVSKHECTCEHNKTPHFCFFLWRNAMIQGEGDLFPCCYITNIHLGRLDNPQSTEWRNHPFITNMRQRLFEGDIPEPCVNCPQLQEFDRSVILKSAYQEIRNFIRG